jgi:SAM-dependent methyltransferase
MTKEASAGDRLESDYYEFMGYDGNRTRDGQSHYLRFFSAGPVLELACGRGEFLDLLRDTGIEASGVDLDGGMVERATASGHRVAQADAIAYLEQQPAGSLGGVFCAHFLEHLVPDDVVRVYAGAARALRPGGVFVAAVPHAGSLSILGYDFWRDPTHVRFYDPMLLAFFADRAGLTVVESGGNPRNSPGPPPECIPMEYAPEASLSDSLGSLAELAQHVYHGPPGAPRRRQRDGSAVAVADQRAELWSRLSHLVSLLDTRIQAVQHQNAVLRTAYLRLLAALYPASEVYVVAKLPAEEDSA